MAPRQPGRTRRSARLNRLLWTLVAGLAAVAVTVSTGAFAGSATCSLYASTSGSDANSGSSSSPFQSVSRLLAALAPGQVGCLAAGQTFTGDVTISRGGQSGSPVTLTSADPTSPATIRGRIVTKPGGDWVTFSNLRLDGTNAGRLPSPTIGSDHVTLSHDDITNGHTAICIDVIADPVWGTAHYTTIDANRVHGCGELPATNYDHGVYVSGLATTVTNNYIYDNADRGVQLRGSQGAVVRNNVIDGNGEGVIFGDLGAGGNDVAQNIVSNSVVRANVEAWWGSSTPGTGNAFRDNCVFATNANSYYNTNGGVDTSGGGFAVNSVVVGNPLYADRAAADFTLRPGSPCAGYGPQAGVTPGVDGAAPPAPAPAPAPPPPTTTPATAPAATAAPTIQGTAAVGQPLSATAGTWTGTAPLAYAYAWQRCDATGSACAAIAGATASAYTPTSADAGARLRVAVTASNAGGQTISTSSATSAVAAAPTVAPFAVTQSIPDGATISGLVSWTVSASGASVSRVDFSVDGVKRWTERYAPYVFNGDNATLDTSTLAPGAHTLSVVAVATTGAVATATSRVTVRTAVVAPAVTTAPAIAGIVATNHTLTAFDGSWSGTAPLSLSRQWLRCTSTGTVCVPIAGATGPGYVVQRADVGFRIALSVTAVNAAGSAAAQSAATALVTR